MPFFQLQRISLYVEGSTAVVQPFIPHIRTTYHHVPMGVPVKLETKLGRPLEREMANSSFTHTYYEDGSRSISVSCGSARGELHVDRYKDGRSFCVENKDGRFVSLTDFERLGGKENNKKWKTSVKHNGKTLEFWFKNGLATFTRQATSSSVDLPVSAPSSEDEEEMMDTSNSHPMDTAALGLPEISEATGTSINADVFVHAHVKSGVSQSSMVAGKEETIDISSDEGDVIEISSDEEIEPEPPLLVKHGEMIEKRFKKLFPHQIEALNRLDEWFSSPETTNKTAVVAMPTGSGKTGIICCLPYKLGALVSRKDCAIDLHKPILIIAPDLTILNQLEENLHPVSTAEVGKPFMYKLGLIKHPREEHALYRVKRIETSKDFRKDIISVNHIILTNSQKMHVREGVCITWKELPDDMFSCVIVDEAHHLPAPTWNRIITKFGVAAKVAFFTATPYRSDKKIISDDLPTTGLAYHLQRSEAINKRIIRGTDFIELTERSGLADEETFINKLILKEIHQRLKEKNSRQPLPNNQKHTAIAIATTQPEADKLQQLWSEKYDSEDAEVYHSRVPINIRALIMRKLQEGNVKLLIVVGMLREGFDYPPISIAAIFRKIGSPVAFTQFIGRAQRIVRFGSIEEDASIKADIVTHSFYNQEQHYDNFCDESLIPTKEDA